MQKALKRKTKKLLDTNGSFGKRKRKALTPVRALKKHESNADAEWGAK